MPRGGGQVRRYRESRLLFSTTSFSPPPISLLWWPISLGIHASQPKREASGPRPQKPGSIPGNPAFQPRHFALLSPSLSIGELRVIFPPGPRQGAVPGRGRCFVQGGELRAVLTGGSIVPSPAWAGSAASPFPHPHSRRAPSPLSPRLLPDRTKAAPRARGGLRKHSRFQTGELSRA